ncbi:MAG: phosphate propanoyltransferase [Erysipelothrix sp.]|nr:phosphate propanoyltransferase [Erysipelothrix sp.]
MENKILVEISARHVHLSDADLEVLFGKGHKLHNLKELSQPGQFATEERVSVKGPKGQMDRVIVLGPTRPETQVELSATDARSLGINTEIRMSGDTKGTAGATLIGPAGSVDLDHGVIIAKRHIHVTPDEAKGYGIEDGETVSLKIDTDQRSLIFGDVVVRVNENFSAAVHIDTDEGNAASIPGSTMGTIIK